MLQKRDKKQHWIDDWITNKVKCELLKKKRKEKLEKSEDQKEKELEMVIVDTIEEVTIIKEEITLEVLEKEFTAISTQVTTELSEFREEEAFKGMIKDMTENYLST